MKKKVIKDEVVIRSGKAERDGTRNEKGVIYKGFEIEVIETVTGEKIDENDVWYKDRNGDYYWSGGFEQKRDDPTEAIFDFEYPEEALDWWHIKYKIPEIWNKYKTRGEKCKIAIIDSGLDSKSYGFEWSNIDGYNYLVDKENHFDDEDGHGTKVASIICAYDSSILGVAPKTKLYVAKFMNKGAGKIADLKKAIDGIPDSVDVIVISQEYRKNQVEDFITQIQNSINNRSDKIIICAAGNTRDDSIIIPATLENVLSISAIDKNDRAYEAGTRSTLISFSAPGVNLKTVNSFDRNKYPDSGTSYSAPFVAGVFALLISYIRVNEIEVSNQELIQIVYETLIKSEEFPLEQYGKGIIDPNSIFEKLTTTFVI